MNWLKEKLLASVKLLNRTPKASTDLSTLMTRIENLEKEKDQLKTLNSTTSNSVKTLSILIDGLAMNQKTISSQIQHVMDGLEILLSSFYEPVVNNKNNSDEWN